MDLRQYIESQDNSLGIRINNFWKYVAPIIERQNRQGSNENGYAHVEKVEQNAWLLIEGAKKSLIFLFMNYLFFHALHVAMILTKDYRKNFLMKRDMGKVLGNL